ncbi:hypothetical protein REJC140_00940 [Pseudorhizobium endolithicum]|uniref:Outer membrane beta-barrel protein n=1 Tax=Pseudorhizobium endolithicum TaxID=1191678 RepID=A0ABN7JPE2_9HYPH|nr:outer membrane beta-barrel protein [Pseudorhizobium endolithicum]CAD7040902.1 hypothetical protein REJC140_00940 [Pseudorhizobium endolithicum]
MDEQGERKAPRLKALAILLACTSLANAGTAFGQSSSALGTAPSAQAAVYPGSLPPLPGTASASGVAAIPSAAGNTADQAAAPDADPTTASISSAERSPAISTDLDPPYEEDLNQPFDEPLGPIDAGEAPALPGDPTGIRLGTFMLRPSVSQTINRETIRTGDVKTRRDYLSTAIRGTLTSDWSRHELSIDGEGTFERDIGNRDDIEPEGRLDANLRLDLADDTVANLSAGYSFEREDNDDPNAIGGATVQSGVHQFDTGLTLERDAGLIRGLAGVGVSREVYTDAELQDGSSLDLGDRNRTTVDGRLRLGYALSPALVPFVEVGGGRSVYDDRYDSSGYERSAWRSLARAGVEFDLGEKLRGELAAGYERVDYDDARLAHLDGLTLDGRAVWSPQRGTDVELALRTTLQDATAPGASGWAEYDLTAVLTHQLRHRLVGRLTGGATLRDFPEGEDETTWSAGAGLAWAINPYLDLTGDVEYEQTLRSGDDTDTLRAGVGLTLRK